MSGMGRGSGLKSALSICITPWRAQARRRLGLAARLSGVGSETVAL